MAFSAASPVARLPRALFSVLRSLFSGARQRPLVLRVLRDSRAAFGLIAAKGGGPGFNLCGSSKPPNLQTSKLPLRVLPREPAPNRLQSGGISSECPLHIVCHFGTLKEKGEGDGRN